MDPVYISLPDPMHAVYEYGAMILPGLTFSPEVSAMLEGKGLEVRQPAKVVHESRHSTCQHSNTYCCCYCTNRLYLTSIS